METVQAFGWQGFWQHPALRNPSKPVPTESRLFFQMATRGIPYTSMSRARVPNAYLQVVSRLMLAPEGLRLPSMNVNLRTDMQVYLSQGKFP